MNNEMTQILELSGKNFKVAIVKMLHWVIKDTLKTNQTLNISVKK